MRINIISDLHLEFAPLTLPGGDVLVLAGDACEVRSLVRDHRAKAGPEPVARKLYCLDFFEKECAKYEHEIYVFGNHEHYHNHLEKSHNQVREILPDNVHLLEDETYTIEDVTFVGSTLWTDMNRGDDLTMWHVKSMMSDFRVITEHNPVTGAYHRL